MSFRKSTALTVEKVLCYSSKKITCKYAKATQEVKELNRDRRMIHSQERSRTRATLVRSVNYCAPRLKNLLTI